MNPIDLLLAYFMAADDPFRNLPEKDFGNGRWKMTLVWPVLLDSVSLQWSMEELQHIPLRSYLFQRFPELTVLHVLGILEMHSYASAEFVDILRSKYNFVWLHNLHNGSLIGPPLYCTKNWQQLCRFLLWSFLTRVKLMKSESCHMKNFARTKTGNHYFAFY